MSVTFLSHQVLFEALNLLSIQFESTAFLLNEERGPNCSEDIPATTLTLIKHLTSKDSDPEEETSKEAGISRPGCCRLQMPC